MTMRTKDQKLLFLDMQEHPENYTDEQLENMMNQLDQTPDAEQAWQEFEASHAASLPMTHFAVLPLIRKVAAIFVGILLLSGIAFAAIRLVRSHSAEPLAVQAEQANTHQANQEATIPVRFDDTRLDSILTVVSAHYGKAVRFHSEEAKSLKFIMTWNPDATLADFIDRMNMFDGLRITLRQDTIFVETPESKVSK
mgnify:CR=1 FL=1